MCIEFVWLVGFLTSSSTTRLSRGPVPRLTSDNFTCRHTETGRGHHDFCLSRSQFTGSDPTSKERTPAVGIESTISWPEVARSTDWVTAHKDQWVATYEKLYSAGVVEDTTTMLYWEIPLRGYYKPTSLKLEGKPVLVDKRSVTSSEIGH